MGPPSRFWNLIFSSKSLSETVRTLPEIVNPLPENVRGHPEMFNPLPEIVRGDPEMFKALPETVGGHAETVERYAVMFKSIFE